MHVPLTLGRRSALLSLISAIAILVAACSQPTAAPAGGATSAAVAPATAVSAPTTVAAPTTAAAPATTAEAAPATAAEAAPATAAAAPAGEPILVGVSTPLTGDNASTGAESMNGAKLAADQINAKGGVLGRPIQIVEGDDRCDPKEGAAVAQKFASTGVVAAASHYCSGVALAALPIFQEAGILYADWGAVSSKIPAFGYDKYFSIIYNGDQPGAFAATFTVDKLGKKKLAMIDDRTPANGEFTAAFKKTAEAKGAEIVMAENITQGDKDFSAIVTKLKGSGAEVIYVSTYYPEAGLITKQIRDQQVPITIVCVDGCLDPQYLTIAGAAAEGVYSVTQPQATELESAKQFVDDYKAKYNATPGYVAPYAFDAVNTIAAAYTGAGKVDNDAAAQWLHGLTEDTALKGVTGPLFWTENGTLPSFFFSVYLSKGGKFEFVPT
jgi:branched-chain amino acid transport system substrate-binding protein